MDLTFKAGTNILDVRIQGKQLYFLKTVQGIPTIHKASIVLKHMSETKLKDKEKIEVLEKIAKMEVLIKDMNGEVEIMEYVKKELEGIGFKLIMFKKPGFRPEYIREKVNG